MRDDPAIWRRPPFIGAAWLRWSIGFGIALYLATAIGSVDINWVRLAAGLPRGARFLSSFFPPDFLSRGDEIVEGLEESLAMTVTATAAGVALGIPLGLGAARNLAARPIYLICRTIIAGSRTLQELIVAIFFVKMFGFGPFAGMLTLTFSSVGFIAKLIAERIEAVETAPLDAIRSTGASWLQWVNYAIQPQVMPRLVGLSLYRLDINFRESAVLGIVGAGGIGATLNTALDRYEYGTAAAILLSIVAIVLIAEYTSGSIRERLR